LKYNIYRTEIIDAVCFRCDTLLNYIPNLKLTEMKTLLTAFALVLLTLVGFSQTADEFRKNPKDSLSTDRCTVTFQKNSYVINNRTMVSYTPAIFDYKGHKKRLNIIMDNTMDKVSEISSLMHFYGWELYDMKVIDGVIQVPKPREFESIDHLVYTLTYY